MGRKFKQALAYSLMSVASFCIMVPPDAILQQKDTTEWTAEISNSHGGAYLAKHTGDGDTVHLRIYDARSKRILAARDYPAGISYELRWRADRVVYDRGGKEGYEEGHIDLPPTYLDWWLARLP